MELEKRTKSFKRKSKNVETRYFHIKDLVSHDNKEFMVNAYQAIFNRRIDEKGQLFYIDKLNVTPKIQVIRELLTSPEGRKNNVKVKGLFRYSLLEVINKFLFVKPFFQKCKKLNPLKSFISKQNVLKNLINDLEIRLHETETKLLDLKKSVAHVRSKVSKQDAEISSMVQDLGIHLEKQIPDWEDFYLALENEFRGSRELIKERLQVYIPILNTINVQDINSSVLDIGCGRGEWLELLQERNFNVQGIDINKSMAEECLRRNLPIVNEDVVTFLRQQPSNTFKAITGFQVIEHLPFIYLINLLEESYRTLKKGGVVIFETPNITNINVGTCSYYLDPTHKKPLPPGLMEFILKYKGFNNVEILRLNPAGEIISKNDALLVELEKIIKGPQDYAVIGYKF